jgi:hypothetical protein
MGDKSLAKGKTGRVDWHQGAFRHKTWEDDDGDGDFAWACTIKEDGADGTSACYLYLQEAPILRGLVLSKKTALTKPPLAISISRRHHGTPSPSASRAPAKLVKITIAKGAVLRGKFKRLKNRGRFRRRWL